MPAAPAHTLLLLAWSGKQKREDEVKREMRRREVQEEARRRRQEK